MRYLFLTILGFSWSIVFGQTSQVSPDPEAKKILETIEKENLGAKSMAYDFSLTIQIPEEAPVVQTGSYIQAGKMYFLELENFAFISDGSSQWVIDKEAREIQIHDYFEPDLEDIATPQGLLKIYKNPQFDYMLVFEGNKQGKNIREIEFKPLRKDVEYAKARLTVLKESNQIQSISLFNKDGSRYILKMLGITKDKAVSDQKFSISEKDYPGFHREDLRIE